MHSPLRTARLVLSAPTPDDVDAIAEACADPELARWTPIPPRYGREHAEAFVAEAAERARLDAGYEWVMRVDGAVVGAVSLARRAPGTAELGYWTAASARNQGYLTEAAAAVIDFGFEPAGMSLDRLEWNAAVGNIPSARAARRLGFRFEGVRRGAYVTGTGRVDAWMAGRLFTDAPKPVRWSVLP